MRKSRPVFQTKRYLVDLVSPSEREIKGSSFSFFLLAINFGMSSDADVISVIYSFKILTDSDVLTISHSFSFSNLNLLSFSL